ncbi:aldo/keto reductase [Pseudohoeflea coraliihabitans]|uniref:Aldo/keto reductase n=1 Tax=Pseudohoeflea coraliihabitans TaxID=2860393 RepID=A0ABS6WSK8_9HYPH|nr:aldo/keto reductase [Pseudohoeflea sp. DP4N28-3]MBW3098412.1 aldo/keto reductase [Pseudohoeflea sp. DP4N28-3]
MQLRKLGNHGLQTAPLVFGGNVFGWTADKQTSFDLLDRLLDRGFATIDTADVYSAWATGNSGGESEAILGEWLAARKSRNKVILMTKVAKKADRRGLSAANIETAIEDSLRRLRTDFVDVYFAHEDDPAVRLEETLEAFGTLQKAGKVRSIGASNYSPDRIEAALATAKTNDLPAYEIIQPEYNLLDRDDFEGALAATVRAHKLDVVSYFSLASGFLSGKYRSREDVAGAAREGRVAEYFDARGSRVMTALRAIAADHRAAPAQVALAWLMAKDGVTAPIVSARSLDQLEEVQGAVQIELSERDIEQLDDAGR